MMTPIVLALVMQLAVSRSLQPADIERMMQENGSQKTLSFLFDDDRRWDRVLTSVATGQRAWVNVAAKLREVSDAHASETLDMAMQEALLKNPLEVLRLVARGSFDVSNACGNYGFGQIEDERPTRVLVGLVDKRIAAVSRVRAQELTTSRDRCLEQLRNLRTVLQRNKSH
jgi:hypothetical protein